MEIRFRVDCSTGGRKEGREGDYRGQSDVCPASWGDGILALWSLWAPSSSLPSPSPSHHPPACWGTSVLSARGRWGRYLFTCYTHLRAGGVYILYSQPVVAGGGTSLNIMYPFSYTAPPASHGPVSPLPSCFHVAREARLPPQVITATADHYHS